MSRGVASSADLKVANFVCMSPPMTDITLGRQTMVGSMTWFRFLTGRACIHGAEEPMVTEICTNVALGGGRAGTRVPDEDLRRGGSDPLSFDDLDMDDIVVVY